MQALQRRVALGQVVLVEVAVQADQVEAVAQDREALVAAAVESATLALRAVALTPTMGETPRQFQDVIRCPTCLELGKMQYQYGDYYCVKCAQRWPPDKLQFFLKAFEAGRNFERQANG